MSVRHPIVRAALRAAGEGACVAYHRDPRYRLQVDTIDRVIQDAEWECRDEGIDRDATQRVLERVVKTLIPDIRTQAERTDFLSALMTGRPAPPPPPEVQTECCASGRCEVCRPDLFRGGW